MKAFINTFVQIALIVGVVFAVVAFIVWIDFATSSETVNFYRNNTIVCVTHRSPNTWTYDIDQCMPLATESAILK